MADVFTKGEILQNLASKGYFIDAYTLDTFFQKWKVEAIFEDEQGSEFYDKNALDLVLTNLFNQTIEEEKQAAQDILIPTHESAQAQSTNTQSQIIQPQIQKQAPNPQKPIIEDYETANVLNNIALSDGTPLINKVNDIPLPDIDMLEIKEEPLQFQEEAPATIKKEKKIGILEGAMQAAGQEYKEETKNENENNQPQDEGDYDDMSLLSESFEAQEKFKEYVISELSKKNTDFNVPKNNEFKLDISERTLNMIARTMAKKIAKHVSSICSQDAKTGAKLSAVEEENKKLEKKAKELEEQNRKLRLLLAESNKNLNSYKPSFFGLYKKVPPTK